LVLFNSDTLEDIGNILRRKHTAPGIEATCMPTQWLRAADAPTYL
jgi:hypothetical protein